MKKFFSIILLVITQTLASSQVPPNVTTDTGKPKATDAGSSTSTSTTSSVVTTKPGSTTTIGERNPSQSQTPPKEEDKKNCPCNWPPQDASFGGWVLILSPLVIFFFLFFALLKPALNGFDFKQALAESEYPKATIENKLLAIENLQKLKALDVPPPASTINIQALLTTLPPTVEISNTSGGETKPLPSISRYMGFVSIVLTLIVALCTSSFFIYHYITRGCAPDLSSLSIVLIALTIGIAPYAVNKITAAASSHKED